MIQFDEHIFQMGWNHQLVMMLMVLIMFLKVVSEKLLWSAMFPFESSVINLDWL